VLDSTPTALISPADLAGQIAQQPGAQQPGAHATRDTPEAIAKAATQFEALLIGEVMKSACEADGSGWEDTDQDEPGSTLMEVSEQQIAQALAAAGGLGLAKMISAGLSRPSVPTGSASPS
jgi:Rod binding domain-containing protein